MLEFETLKKQVDAGTVDTVLACIVDMQGRLMGKRFHARHFVDDAFAETHCCDYLLATDLEMATPDGYQATSWKTGYGDYIMKPDLGTLRCAPWLDKTAIVLCDVLDHHDHKPVPHSPRAMLKKQQDRLSALGFTSTMATELEFFLFAQSFAALRQDGYRDLQPISGYNEDYHILQTSREECVMQPLRNHLFTMGIPVEGTKGEAEAGQEELNIRYAEALLTADHHTLAKHLIKELAFQAGHAATFLAKWDHQRVGSSSHVHQSLFRESEPVFYSATEKHGMSGVMRQYLAGLISYAQEYTYFLAPYVNSYKRFAKGTFAPTRAVWSIDNRTAGFRLCAADTKAIRVECRIGGSDMNPYLAMSAMLAAGIKGIEQGLELESETTGDVYEADNAAAIPPTLREATEKLAASDMLREAMGDAVVDHYVRAASWEQEEYDRVVTDWEIARGFERA